MPAATPPAPPSHPPLHGPAPQRRGLSYRARRWLLWALMVAVLLALLATAIALARQFQRNQAQQELELDANALVSDLRNGLVRNIQTLASLQSTAGTPGSWQVSALEILEQNREIVQLEWLDRQMRPLSVRISPFHALAMKDRPRQEARLDVAAACAAARRTNSPAFSASYFWPNGAGMGLELMELCIPLTQGGQSAGYLVATHALSGLLSEMLDRTTVRGRRVALTEVDGTTLVLAGKARTATMVSAQQLLELPGHVMMLRLDSPRNLLGQPYWNVTALVSGMAVVLLVVLGLLGRDMRRRLRVERELADALAFRKAMEDSLVTGLRARDMQGSITYVNPAFCQMVGRPPEQLLGQGTPAPYWPPELMDEYQRRQAIRLAGQTLPREGFESVFMRPDGSRFPVLIIEAPLINAQGTQTGWMSAVLDMSEQRRVEALSRASQDRLQATARLASLGEMASLLSHELNQPLAAIASYATGTLNLLTTPPASGSGHPSRPDEWSDVTEAVRRIGQQAERAGRVIKSVTDFVRRRGHDDHLPREAVDPNELLQAVLPLASLQATKQGVRLQTSVATGCPPVLCDRTLVEQVLLNLTRNGLQAMPEGSPASSSGLRLLIISVHAQASPGQKTWVVFSVTDHGQGLPDEVAAHLFTPFFTTKAEGMGLGLSLCRTVVEQHGGALAHAPAQPFGTVFRFTLPAADAA